MPFFGPLFDPTFFDGYFFNEAPPPGFSIHVDARILEGGFVAVAEGGIFDVGEGGLVTVREGTQ